MLQKHHHCFHLQKKSFRSTTVDNSMMIKIVENTFPAIIRRLYAIIFRKTGFLDKPRNKQKGF